MPTMGNLHAGHLSLVKAAGERSDFIVASIFVNPLQFGPNEDFNRYPRTLEADCELLSHAGCDAVFTPSVKEMYPLQLEQQTKISVPTLSTLYCGNSRPGHFDGVCTIVCKLFNMVRPDVAFFGLKDFQQFFLIRRMVADLQQPIELVGIPTVREPSGLAMSSRNGYLTPAEKEQAAFIYATLTQVGQSLLRGRRDLATLEQEALGQIAAAGLRPDYFRIVNSQTLLPASGTDRQLVVLVAAYLGTTRLIDNLEISL